MSFLVFISQSEIEFHSDIKSQTIKIYNPYDFSIYFNFKSTRPNAFLLSTTEGEIPAKHSLDVVITLLDKSIIEEKFQIRIYTASRERKLGEKIVKAIFKSSTTETNVALHKKENAEVDHFQELGPSTSYRRPRKFDSYGSVKMEKEKHPSQYLVYSALIICILVLLLPHEDSDDSPIQYLKVSISFKLAAAYVLGIATVFIIRNS